MTVNLGQGANCAIEDVAVLTNLINAALQGKPKRNLSGHEVDDLLRRFNKSHLARVTHICKTSWLTTRIHARDGLLPKTIGRYGMPYLGFLFEGRPFNMIADAAALDFVPLPRTSFPGWARYKSRDANVRPWLIAVLSCFLAYGYWASTY